MKKILLLLIVVLSAILPMTAENFVDSISTTILGTERNDVLTEKSFISPESNTEYIITADHYYSSMTNQVRFRNAGDAKAGMVVKKAYGRLVKVSLDWTILNNTSWVEIYGSNTPYTSVAALYDEGADLGTKLAECVNTDKKKGEKIYNIENKADFKYYAFKLGGTAPVLSTNFKSLAFEYEPLALEACAPIVAKLADGSLIASNDVTLAAPGEMEVSCATEGSVISYSIDGAPSVNIANPGKINIERGCKLEITAAKDGFEASTRTINISIPMKLEVKAAGATIVTDVLRAYGKSAVELVTYDGAAISWEYGGKTGTSSTLEVEADGTLKVSAVKDGFITAERTLEVVACEPLTSIQAVWNAYPLNISTEGSQWMVDEEPMTVLFDATVVYVANVVPMASATGKLPDGQIYITDGTNFSRIYLDDKSSDLKPGDVIAAGWTAKFRRGDGWKEFLPQGELTVKSHDGLVPAPVAVGSQEALEALDPGTPVVVGKVTLNSPTLPGVVTNENYIAASGSPVDLVNAFGLPSQAVGVYDVYGIADFYGYKRTNAPAVGPTDGGYSHRRWRVAVTRWEDWLPTAPRPRFELSTGAEVDSGEPIVITCQDAEATIMYRFDEEEYAAYDPENKPVMPARDVTVSAYAVKEGNHDSAVRTVTLKYSGNAGIGAISADAAGEARYYDLQGRPVAKPATGLYIKVENGKAGKVAL